MWVVNLHYIYIIFLYRFNNLFFIIVLIIFIIYLFYLFSSAVMRVVSDVTSASSVDVRVVSDAISAC